MRHILLAAVLTLCPTLAVADASIAGQWIADAGRGVEIVMDIIGDGHWFSTTVQDGKVVAELAGTYQQTKSNDATGKLTFTPTSSKTTSEHGAAKVEEDEYTLSGNGTQLMLTTAGEAMKFTKQPFAK